MKTRNTVRMNLKDLVVRTTKRPAKLKIQRKCKYCGVDFIAARRTAKYCSESCRVLEFKRNNS